MPWPDEKALRGFRSIAQANWAKGTKQWFYPEYHKNTDYSTIPYRVQEDDDEGIEEYDVMGNKVEVLNDAEGDYYQDFENDPEGADDDFEVPDPDEQLNKNKTVTAYEIGEKIANNMESDDFYELMDWFDENKNDPEVTKSLVKGLLYSYKRKADQSNTVTLHENALIRKFVRNGTIDSELAEEFWNKSVKEQKRNKGTSSKEYWKGVVERFKKKVNHLDVLEAKRIMERKNNLKASIEGFLDNIATGSYAEAQQSIPNIVQNQLATMINSKKEAYLKELGKSVKERAKEV